MQRARRLKPKRPKRKVVWRAQDSWDAWVLGKVQEFVQGIAQLEDDRRVEMWETWNTLRDLICEDETSTPIFEHDRLVLEDVEFYGSEDYGDSVGKEDEE